MHCDSIQHGGFREDSASVRSRARHQPPHCGRGTARERLSWPHQEEVEEPPDLHHLCPGFCGDPQQSTDLHLQHPQHLTGGQPARQTQNIVGSTSCISEKMINKCGINTFKNDNYWYTRLFSPRITSTKSG